MKIALKLLLIYLALLCHVPDAGASDAVSQESGRRAQELLDLSDRQNFYDHALALQTAKEALVLFQATDDDVGIAHAYAQVARCYFAHGDLIEATQIYEGALQLWRKQNNTRQQAAVLIMLGYVEDKKGDWLNAISYLTQAQALVNEQSDPSQMGQIASGLAYLFNESGLPESGLTQYQRALDYYRQTPDARDDKRMILAIGYTNFLLGNYSTSLVQLRQALASFDPSSLDAAECHEYLGRVHMTIGDYAAGLHHLEATLAVYEKAGNITDSARVRALIGQIYQQEGDVARARKIYLETLKTFGRLSDQVDQAAVFFALGRLELKSGNLQPAEQYLRQSIENTENMRRATTSRDLTAAFSASVHERYHAYIECLMRKDKSQPAQGFDVRAFEASELAGARSLAELLRDTQTNLMANIDPQLTEQEKSLRQSLRAKEDYKVVLLGRPYKKQDLAAMEGNLAQLREEYKLVAEKIRKLNPSYDQISQPSAYSLEQIQKQIIQDDQTVLLEYSLGTDISYVWAVSRHNISSYELPKEAVITEAVRRVYELLSSAPGMDSDNKLNKAAQELGEMVLAPVVGQLIAPRIIVVADGALNYIPFQFLTSPLADREQLIAGYEIINAPSASVLGQLRQERAKRPPPGKVLAAFGDAVFASDYAQRKDSNSKDQLVATQKNDVEAWRNAWRDVEINGDSVDPSVIQPLFYTKIELANLRDLAGAETFVATGFDATREKLESTDFTKYAILHFATHGILDPKRPERSGLFLSMVDRDGKAQNGFITIQDIYGLHLPVDLVVLSACRTGLGKDVRGEGLIGLTRGFMYAGASSVVASLWKVDDEATAELMKRFYTNMLQKGMTPGAALRVAQNSIRQEARWRAPYYWAAFTLQGEYEQAIKAVPIATAPVSNKMLARALLVAFFAGIGWWYYRHRLTRA